MMRWILPLALLIGAALALWMILTAGDPAEPIDDFPDQELDSPESRIGERPRVSESALAERGTQREEVRSPFAPEREAIIEAGLPVQGRVQFASGGSVIHALVWSEIPGLGTAQTSSLADGRYTLDLPAGRHQVKARFEGTGTAAVEVEVSDSARINEAPTLILGEGGVIQGQLFETDGTPIPGFRVKCQAEDGQVFEFFGEGGTHYRFGGDDVLTGKDGGFRLKGLEQGAPHTVVVELLPGQDLIVEPERMEGVIPGGGALRFLVRAIRSIEGRVLDAGSSAPIRHFKINGRIHDDRNGHFETVVKSRQTIVFEAPGYRLQERADLRLQEGEARRGLEIRMQPDPDVGTVELHVRNDAGQPLSEVRIHTSPMSMGGWTRTVELNDGMAVVEGVPPGEAEWKIGARGHASTRTRFTVRSGEESRAEVTLIRGAAARLRILDRQGSLWSGDIAVENADGSGPEFHFAYARTHGTLTSVTEETAFGGRAPARISLLEAEGRIEELAAGRYTLSIYFSGEPRKTPFQILPGAEIDLVIHE